MDTKFKKGMKVYDEIFHKGETLTVKYNPNLEGIKLIQDEYYDWNVLEVIPTLSIEPYTLQGFK